MGRFHMWKCCGHSQMLTIVDHTSCNATGRDELLNPLNEEDDGGAM